MENPKSVCRDCKHRDSVDCRQPKWALVLKCEDYEKERDEDEEDETEVETAPKIKMARPKMRSNAFCDASAVKALD